MIDRRRRSAADGRRVRRLAVLARRQVVVLLQTAGLQAAWRIRSRRCCSGRSEERQTQIRRRSELSSCFCQLPNVRWRRSRRRWWRKFVSFRLRRRGAQQRGCGARDGEAGEREESAIGRNSPGLDGDGGIEVSPLFFFRAGEEWIGGEWIGAGSESKGLALGEVGTTELGCFALGAPDSDAVG